MYTPFCPIMSMWSGFQMDSESEWPGWPTQTSEGCFSETAHPILASRPACRNSISALLCLLQGVPTPPPSQYHDSTMIMIVTSILANLNAAAASESGATFVHNLTKLFCRF